MDIRGYKMNKDSIFSIFHQDWDLFEKYMYTNYIEKYMCTNDTFDDNNKNIFPI